MTTQIFLKLLLSHILTDFFLQPTNWVKDKQTKKYKSVYLYTHGFLAGLLAYVFLAEWLNFKIPIFIFVSHTLIDLWKLYQKDNLKFFILDQIFHLIILIISYLWVTATGQGVFDKINVLLQNPKYLAIAIGYLICTTPLSFLIDKATKKWQSEIENKETETLSNAGKWIGITERVLTLTFVLIEKFEPIGFLLAAKSIIRFKDTEGKKSEYVLIGTLISYGLAVLIGLVIKKIFM